MQACSRPQSRANHRALHSAAAGDRRRDASARKRPSAWGSRRALTHVPPASSRRDRRRGRGDRARPGPRRRPRPAEASISGPRRPGRPDAAASVDPLPGRRRRPRPAPGRRALRSRSPAPASSSRSILFQTSITRRPASAQRPVPPAPCARPRPRPRCRGPAMSRTCRMTSASLHLLQGGAEGLDQLVRQVGDEADGVGQDRRAAARQLQARAGSDRGWRTACPWPRPRRRSGG